MEGVKLGVMGSSVFLDSHPPLSICFVYFPPWKSWKNRLHLFFPTQGKEKEM